MFDLDREVAAWRKGFAGQKGFSTWDLDELEDHLRAAYDVELDLNPGLAPAEAFQGACEAMGSPQALSLEFAKVEGQGWRKLLSVGWAVFTVAFFLPVVHFGITLGQGDFREGFLPGFQALWLALTGGGGAIGVASSLTNGLMAATWWKISDAGRTRVQLLAGAASISALLNVCWIVLSDDPSQLMVGYYAWLSSFWMVASALWLRARALPAAVSDPDPMALE